MATEAQFASLNGTVSQGVWDEPWKVSKSVARRSVSIFSRRGTESPEPRPPFIAQAAMRRPNQMTERQRSWIKRKNSSAGDEPKKPKATVLNAVPPAKTIPYSRLEEESLRSPNEEILSAVGGGSPTQIAFASSSHQASPIQSPLQETNSFWSKTPMLPAQRTPSEKRRENNARIGVWVNGIAQWDEHVRKEQIEHEQSSVEEQTGFAPVVRSPGGPSLLQTRPQLSVIIPTSEPLINDKIFATLMQPAPHRPIGSVAPASIVTRYGLPTPTIVVQESCDVSPIEPSYRRPVTPPSRPKTPRQREAGPDISPTRTLSGSPSNSVPSSSDESDDSSHYSQRSSATSIEALAVRSTLKKDFSKLDAPIPDNSTSVCPDVNKPLPPSPIPIPQRPAPAPPTASNSTLSQGPKVDRRSSSVKSAPTCGVKPGPKLAAHFRSSKSVSELDLMDRAFLRTAPSYSDQAEPDSPTLSQAADDLETHLSSITDDSVKSEDAIADNEPTAMRCSSFRRSDSVRSVMQPRERAPTLPRRSRKREWRVSRNREHAVQFSSSTIPKRRRSDSSLRQPAIAQAGSCIPQTLRQSMSAVELSKACDIDSGTENPQNEQPPPTRIVINDGLIVLHGPVTVHASMQSDKSVSQEAAEGVLLQILAALRCPSDLFNTALVNKGMYRVYKENEMQLIRDVTYNQSPAAWEFREWCPPEQNAEQSESRESLQVEQSPLRYMHSFRRDHETVESLKAVIVRCCPFIRRETAFALSTPNHPHAQRFTDAFWRIWCFCKIFGCNKGREEDITGQLDWLKGGVLANNDDLTATMNMNLDFDMGSVLLNPPEFFARGNAGGLSAQQLYDMSEIWSCLTTILSVYHNRTKQARQSGVFDGCDFTDGTVQGEEQALEEWTAYLLTLGPVVVLEMAQFAFDDSSAGFVFAKINGWTQWSTTSSGGSRIGFLKEPVARLYEERVAAAALQLQNPQERERQELSRKRVANLAAEIKLARQASTYKRLPMIDMNMERTMSNVSRQNSNISTYAHQSQASVAGNSPSSSVRIPHPPNFSVPRPRSPPTSLWAPRKISPIIEDRVETFNRMSLQHFAAGEAEQTSERAVKLIVDMGFSETQAREALKTTDLGDGLRVDRAVDMLLRRQKYVFR